MAAARVLVIEDDEPLLDMLALALEDEGYTVHAARGGLEAVAMARENPLDLVVADVRMKDMDGLTALSKIQVFAPELLSIIMTGFADDSAPLRALELKACDYLHKPFSLKDFLTAVERALRAEEERQKGFGLLRGLLAGVRKIADKVVEAGVSRQIQALEPLRQQAFGQFFLSVRSQRLDLRGAAMVWEYLEQAEREIEVLKQGEGRPDPADRLTKALDLIGAYCRNPNGSFSLEQPRVEKATFQEFYRRVQSGLVSAQQLPLAAQVRLLTPFELRQSEELMTVYSRFWWSAART